MHAGVLVGPGMVRRRTSVPPETRAAESAPVLWPSGQDAGPSNPVERRGTRGRRSRWKSHRPGCRTPPLTWTLPSRTLSFLYKPRSMMTTPDPLFILDTLSFLDTLFYYFCSMKAFPRPDTTPTESVVCSSRHNIQIIF